MKKVSITFVPKPYFYMVHIRKTALLISDCFAGSAIAGTQNWA